MKKFLLPVATVALSTVAALLVVELLLRAWYLVHNRLEPRQWQYAEDWGWQPTPDQSLVYTKPGYGEIVYSSTRDGFRRFGDPHASKLKVLAVGDSTTHAYQVSDGQAYYDFLADHDSGLELFAFGAGGYGTVQQAMAIQRYAGEISPDVVIWQMCANDLTDNDWRLEGLSTENNIHMRRPYLEDGRIVRRHPDGRLGWLAEHSVVARRLVALRSSLLMRLNGTIESGLDLDHPDLRRALATTREAMQQVIEAAPGVTFLAFFVPSAEHYQYEIEAFTELCTIPRLRCLPEVHEAVAAAALGGIRIDGGDYDSHWNAAGHAIAGRVILDRLRHELPARLPAGPHQPGARRDAAGDSAWTSQAVDPRD